MIKDLFVKYREIISYLFFGGLTTAVSFGIFFVFNLVLGEKLYLISQGISWVAAVSFAFVTNKLYVFQKTGNTPSTVISELWKFASVRFITGLLETGLLMVLVDIIGAPVNPSKIGVCFLVIVLNYIFSKLLIFRQR